MWKPPMLVYVKFVVVYLVFCAVLGLLGRRRKLGSAGYFIASLLLTPLIGLLLLLASDPRPVVRSER